MDKRNYDDRDFCFWPSWSNRDFLPETSKKRKDYMKQKFSRYWNSGKAGRSSWEIGSKWGESCDCCSLLFQGNFQGVEQGTEPRQSPLVSLALRRWGRESGQLEYTGQNTGERKLQGEMTPQIFPMSVQYRAHRGMHVGKSPRGEKSYQKCLVGTVPDIYSGLRRMPAAIEQPDWEV